MDFLFFHYHVFILIDERPILYTDQKDEVKLWTSKDNDKKKTRLEKAKSEEQKDEGEEQQASRTQLAL